MLLLHASNAFAQDAGPPAPDAGPPDATTVDAAPAPTPTQGDTAASVADAGGVTLLRKPFSNNALVEAVVAALRSKPCGSS